MDHIDRDPGNNAQNLQYLTHAQQIAQSYATNPNRRSNAGRCSKAIKATRVGDDVGAEQEAPLCFASQREAARELGVDQGSISACCQGKQKTARGKDGQRWRFCRDTDAGEPECIEGEEWRDVVMAPVDVY